MDSFFDNNKQLEVLKEQYKKHDKIIVSFDFDDTIKPFRGNNCNAIRQLIRDIKPYSYLICYTAREISELEMVKDYLIDNNIPFDYINKEYNGKEIIGKKMYYNILLDDKAGLYDSYKILSMFLDWIQNKNPK